MSEGYISEVGIDVEDLPQTTNEEELAALEQSFDNLTSKRFDKKVELTLEQINEVREELQDKEDELEDLLNGNNLDDNDERRIEEALEEIEKMMEALDEFRDNFSEFVDDHKEWEETHSRKYRPGDEVLVENIELGAPGEDTAKNTYTYDLGIGSTNIFGDAATAGYEALIERGTINSRWEVLRDENNDGKLNKDDIEFANQQIINDPELAQNIFINLDATYIIESVASYNPVGGELTLKVADPEGNFSYLTFKGIGSANFHFGSGITAEFAQNLVDNYPDLAKKFFIAEDNKSFYDHSHDMDDLPLEEQLAYIKGYKAVTEGLATSVRHISGSLTGASPDVAGEVIDKLFSYINDSSALDLNEVWNEIDRYLIEQEITNEVEKSRILQAVIFAIAENAPHLFSTFFGPVVARLEMVLDKDMVTMEGTTATEPSASAKAALLILNLKAAGGNYGGSEMLKLFYPDPNLEPPVLTGFKDVTSMKESLEIYKQIIGRMDGVYGEGITTADFNKLIGVLSDSTSYTMADETVIIVPEGETLDHSPIYDSAKKEFEEMRTNFDVGYANATFEAAGIGADEWSLFIFELNEHLFDNDGNMIDNPMTAIKKVFSNDEEGENVFYDVNYNDMVALLILHVDHFFSPEFKAKFFSDKFKNEVGTWLDDIGDETFDADEFMRSVVQAILGRNTESTDHGPIDLVDNLFDWIP